MIQLHNNDCLEAMKQMDDKHFDLAIVDPPYGIGANKMTLGNGKRKVYRGQNDWDANPPSKEYFNELFRVSKNQIIWGANHFIEQFSKNSSCWLFWDKGTGANDFADGELAWTSFNGAMRKIFISWVGANAKEKNEIDRIHPTQKPVKLYEWILDKYANEGDKILDTHLGSGSIALACHNRGFDLTGFEIDKEYYDNAVERLRVHQSQLTMF
jgi:site-specific DNA-methyltransferase (adenine-specific)